MKTDLEQTINRYLEEIANKRNLSLHTTKAYQNDLTNLQTYFTIINYPIVTLSQYIYYLKHDLQRKDKTIQRKIITIKSFIRWCIQNKIEPPLEDDFSERTFITARILPKTLSPSEIHSLLNALEHQLHTAKSQFKKVLAIRDKAIIELLFSLGLRISELVSINISDIDFIENTILINGKNRKQRILYISSREVHTALVNWLNIRQALNPQDTSVFINKFGNRLSIYSIENIFEKYRQLAQITKHATPHYLRHTFATMLLNNGANIREVQELLGHSSILTTQIYTEVSTERKRLVLEKYNHRNSLSIST